MMTRFAAVILAAGQSTRFKSASPKIIHPVAGLPMALWSVHSARAVGAHPIVLVVGAQAEMVKEAIGPDVSYVFQEQRLGTGHATLQARPLLEDQADMVLLLYGDMPALRAETLARMVAVQREKQPALTMLSVESQDSMGFGRVVRDASGKVLEIVEEAVATPEIMALMELNCGVYCFDAQWLWTRLPQVRVTPPKGEYYLTDMIGIAVAEGRAVEVVKITDVQEVQGVNTRQHLARVERILRDRIREKLMLGGVTLVDPASAYVDVGVQVGRDTVIHPNTHLQGQTVVGSGCVLGPNSIIRDSRIGDNCRVLASVIEEATLEDHVEIGPFGHLRQGAHLASGVHMGNFGEVKNAHLASGVKMGHFSYIGDAEVGEDVNIGAGTITCNFDGARKHKTIIRAGAFIGSGSMLVAPLTIGKKAKIGAGSVVTRDVDGATLAYGVPARTVRKLDQEGECDDA
jgi:bifunctional UDP-N-acetylglucosamine pyrophosphorylase/glucosamine-1-phosphate N-acetyltransferase